MSLKAGGGIELTFKKFMLRRSEGKRTIERLRETHCRLRPCFARARHPKIEPKRSQARIA
jgi:hypothetical protein